MDLVPVLTRLQTQLTGFKQVGSAADLDAIQNSVAPTPSCYLVPMSESGEDNALIGGYEQRLTVGFSVIVVSANKRDATGAAASAALEPLRKRIKAALVNWAPEQDIGEPIRFASGSLLRFADGQLWWADEYRVTTYERSDS